MRKTITFWNSLFELPEPEAYYSTYFEFKGKSKNENVFCPFHTHNHETPSLSINKENGAFNCFACGVSGGDVLDFALRKEGVDKPNKDLLRQMGATEVLNHKATKAGMPQFKEHIFSLMAEAEQQAEKAPEVDVDAKAPSPLFTQIQNDLLSAHIPLIAQIEQVLVNNLTIEGKKGVALASYQLTHIANCGNYYQLRFEKEHHKKEVRFCHIDDAGYLRLSKPPHPTERIHGLDNAFAKSTWENLTFIWVEGQRKADFGNQLLKMASIDDTVFVATQNSNFAKTLPFSDLGAFSNATHKAWMDNDDAGEKWLDALKEKVSITEVFSSFEGETKGYDFIDWLMAREGDATQVATALLALPTEAPKAKLLDATEPFKPLAECLNPSHTLIEASPQLCVDTFHPSIRNAIQATHDEMKVSNAMVANRLRTILGCVASPIATIDSGQIGMPMEGANVFCLTIAPPSALKTTLSSFLMASLNEERVRIRNEDKALFNEWQVQKKIREAIVKDLQKELVEANVAFHKLTDKDDAIKREKVQDDLRLAEEAFEKSKDNLLLEPPIRDFLSDGTATTEALIQSLNTKSPILALMNDEGARVLFGYAMKGEQAVDTQATYNGYWHIGGFRDRERIDENTASYGRPVSLSVCFEVQPAMYASWLNQNKGAKGNGFLSRWDVCCEPSFARQNATLAERKTLKAPQYLAEVMEVMKVLLNTRDDRPQTAPLLYTASELKEVQRCFDTNGGVQPFWSLSLMADRDAFDAWINQSNVWLNLQVDIATEYEQSLIGKVSAKALRDALQAVIYEHTYAWISPQRRKASITDGIALWRQWMVDEAISPLFAEIWLWHYDEALITEMNDWTAKKMHLSYLPLMMVQKRHIDHGIAIQSFFLKETVRLNNVLSASDSNESIRMLLAVYHGLSSEIEEQKSQINGGNTTYTIIDGCVRLQTLLRRQKSRLGQSLISKCELTPEWVNSDPYLKDLVRYGSVPMSAGKAKRKVVIYQLHPDVDEAFINGVVAEMTRRREEK